MSFNIGDGQSQITGDFGQLEKLIKNLKSDAYVDIGIFKEAKTSDGMPVATIGAVHEFGTIIKHPGGTPYVLAKNGKAIFVKKGTSGAVGVTGAHDIPVPKRSFIRMPLEEKQEKIASDVEKRAKKHLENGDIKAIFEDIGLAGENAIHEAFASKGFGKWPDNAPGTIAQKGSDMPLIDKGLLNSTVTHKTGGSK